LLCYLFVLFMVCKHWDMLAEMEIHGESKSRLILQSCKRWAILNFKKCFFKSWQKKFIRKIKNVKHNFTDMTFNIKSPKN
jgi:hypothetical protein